MNINISADGHPITFILFKRLVDHARPMRRNWLINFIGIA